MVPDEYKPSRVSDAGVKNTFLVHDGGSEGLGEGGVGMDVDGDHNAVRKVDIEDEERGDIGVLTRRGLEGRNSGLGGFGAGGVRAGMAHSDFRRAVNDLTDSVLQFVVALLPLVLLLFLLLLVQSLPDVFSKLSEDGPPVRVFEGRNQQATLVDPGGAKILAHHAKLMVAVGAMSGEAGDWEEFRDELDQMLMERFLGVENTGAKEASDNHFDTIGGEFREIDGDDWEGGGMQ